MAAFTLATWAMFAMPEVSSAKMRFFTEQEVAARDFAAYIAETADSNDYKNRFNTMRADMEKNPSLAGTAVKALPVLFDQNNLDMWDRALQTLGWINEVYPFHADAVSEALKGTLESLESLVIQENDTRSRFYASDMARIIGLSHADYNVKALQFIERFRLVDDNNPDIRHANIIGVVQLIKSEKSATLALKILEPLAKNLDKFDDEAAYSIVFGIGIIGIGYSAYTSTAIDLLEPALRILDQNGAYREMRLIADEQEDHAQRIVDILKTKIAEGQSGARPVHTLRMIADSNDRYLPDSFEAMASFTRQNNDSAMAGKLAVMGQTYKAYTPKVLAAFKDIISKDITLFKNIGVMQAVSDIGDRQPEYLLEVMDFMTAAITKAMEGKEKNWHVVENAAERMRWLQAVYQVKVIDKTPKPGQAPVPKAP